MTRPLPAPRPVTAGGRRVTAPLTHPLTGAQVALYDPDLHESACWLGVRCGRCGREFVCTPWDDLMTPAPDLGWTGGDVCEPCLYALAAGKATQS